LEVTDDATVYPRAQELRVWLQSITEGVLIHCCYQVGFLVHFVGVVCKPLYVSLFLFVVLIRRHENIFLVRRLSRPRENVLVNLFAMSIVHGSLWAMDLLYKWS
jgi:hypothetical protein